jgi:hypothetical protein
MTNEVLSSLVGPILVALITLGGAWVKEATQRRSQEQTRQQLLSYVKDEIGIIDAWVKAHASVASSGELPPSVRERANQDLDRAYNRIVQLVPGRQSPITLQKLLSRLLLRHIAVTPAVRRWRAFYYFTLFLAGFWGFIAVSDQGSWDTPGDIIGSVVAYFLIAVVPAWIAARLVISSARRPASGSST